jgi:voltage-gated potassium channel
MLTLSFPPHLRTALRILGASVALDTLFGITFGVSNHVGIWDGLYFATTTATTVGYGDITPHGWLPHMIAVGIMLMVIPTFSAFFSLLTTGLTSHHVKQHIKERFNGRPDHHPK